MASISVTLVSGSQPINIQTESIVYILANGASKTAIYYNNSLTTTIYTVVGSVTSINTLAGNLAALALNTGGTVYFNPLYIVSVQAFGPSKSILNFKNSPSSYPNGYVPTAFANQLGSFTLAITPAQVKSAVAAIPSAGGSLPYGVALGTDTYTVTLAPAPTSLATGLTVNVRFINANTGASTLNINGLGAKAILTSQGTALTAGEITAGETMELVYNGTDLVLIGTAVSSNQPNPYGVATGVGPYAVTVSPAITSYVQGTIINVKFPSDNIGNTSLNVNGIGAQDIKTSLGGNIPAKYIKAGETISLVYVNLVGWVALKTVPLNTSEIYTFKTTIAAADFRLLNSIPQELIPPPGANKMIGILVDTIAMRKLTGSVAYDFGPSDLQLVYANFAASVPAFSPVQSTIIGNAVIFDIADEVVQLGSTQNSFSIFAVSAPYPTNSRVWLYSQATDATQGDGDVTITFDYKIIDLS
jgi:hypothetical protein